jgi:FkbM family methyltransferase
VRAPLFTAVKAIARALMATPLRRLPGARSAYERIYLRLAPSEPTVVEFEGSKVCVDPRDVGVSLYLLTEGAYEPRLTALLKRMIKPGMVVVDAGANVGCFTMLAARLVGPQGRVYAFEPVPETFALLCDGLVLNGYGHVIAIPAVLAERDGHRTLHLDRRNLGAPSLRAANVADPGGDLVVQTVTLDRQFARREDPVDLVKLDTQGAEGLVLEGANCLFDNPRLTIVMELWPAGLRSFGTDPAELLRGLRGRGFRLEWLDERSGELAPREDAEVIAWCDARQHEQGFATLVARR